MTYTRAIVTSSVLALIGSVVWSSAAWAGQSWAQQSGTPQSIQQAQQPAAAKGNTGMITVINRINHTIALVQIPSGTTGSDGGGAIQQFGVSDASLLDNVHAGDTVTYAVGESGGKTITKLDKPKTATIPMPTPQPR